MAPFPADTSRDWPRWHPSEPPGPFRQADGRVVHDEEMPEEASWGHSRESPMTDLWTTKSLHVLRWTLTREEIPELAWSCPALVDGLGLRGPDRIGQLLGTSQTFRTTG